METEFQVIKFISNSSKA